MPVWRKIICPILFLGIFAFLFIHISYILRPYAGSASRKNICGFYAEEENSLDIVCVGASSVFAFWEPMKLWKDMGITSYNFATGVLPPQLIQYELEEILKTQSPKLLIIELRPFSIAEDGYYQQKEVANMYHDVPLRNSLDNMRYSANRFKAVLHTVPKDRDRLPYLIDLMKYHSEWDRLLDRQSQLFWNNCAHDVTKGFKLVDKYRPLKHVDYSSDIATRPLSEQLEGILTDLLKYCKEKQLPVLFLVNIYNQKQQDKELYNWMSEIISSYGFPFYNTNDYEQAIGVNFETDYYDNSHTNIFGSEKYMNYMEQYLQANYQFTDHRGESAYASWDEDLSAWEELVKETKESILKKIEEGKAE